MFSSKWQGVISTAKRTTEVTAFVFVAIVVLGCPASRPAAVPPGESAIVSDRPAVAERPADDSANVARLLADTRQPVGSPCASGDECTTGLCEGEGCTGAAPGVCVDAARPCAEDEVLYCGCDGATYTASSTCPGALFSKRGACEPK